MIPGWQQWIWCVECGDYSSHVGLIHRLTWHRRPRRHVTSFPVMQSARHRHGDEMAVAVWCLTVSSFPVTTMTWVTSGQSQPPLCVQYTCTLHVYGISTQTCTDENKNTAELDVDSGPLQRSKSERQSKENGEMPYRLLFYLSLSSLIHYCWKHPSCLKPKDILIAKLETKPTSSCIRLSAS